MALQLVRRLAYKAYELTHPDEPWFAQGAVRFLDHELHRDGKGLEWGSGRSTQWFASRLAHLTSIEFDREWYEKVLRQVADLANVDLRFIPLDHDPKIGTVPRYDPIPAYVAVIDDLPPLDFVLVDGHYRQACVLAALPKIKPGGLLAIDNTNWLPEIEWGVSANWTLVHRSANVMTETSCWRKT
jgi:predicted O-methyltransferase YrrM